MEDRRLVVPGAPKSRRTTPGPFASSVRRSAAGNYQSPTCQVDASKPKPVYKVVFADKRAELESMIGYIILASWVTLLTELCCPLPERSHKMQASTEFTMK